VIFLWVFISQILLFITQPRTMIPEAVFPELPGCLYVLLGNPKFFLPLKNS
ncbi:unnamed protein product, partial [Adineta steineri]